MYIKIKSLIIKHPIMAACSPILVRNFKVALLKMKRKLLI